jgi:hypothetical protein
LVAWLAYAWSVHGWLDNGGLAAGSFGGWVVIRALPKEFLGAGGEYIDVRQCKGADDLAEEGGFLLVGLDQGEGDVWRPELDGDAGESCAGAEVGQTVVG